MGKPDRVVVICGTAMNTRSEIMASPKEAELWGLNTSYAWMPRWDRWFEMHDAPRRESLGAEHLAFLRDAKCPVFMQQVEPGVTHCVAYPFEAVTRGGKLRSRFESTIDYMMALAIHEQVAEIRVLGVNMSQDTEYRHQRPSLEYWIGVAEASGISVYVPARAPIAKAARYGWGAESDSQRMLRDHKDRAGDQLDAVQDKLITKIQQALDEARLETAACQGAIQLADRMLATDARMEE